MILPDPELVRFARPLHLSFQVTSTSAELRSIALSTGRISSKVSSIVAVHHLDGADKADFRGTAPAPRATIRHREAYARHPGHFGRSGTIGKQFLDEVYEPHRAGHNSPLPSCGNRLNAVAQEDGRVSSAPPRYPVAGGGRISSALPASPTREPLLR